MYIYIDCLGADVKCYDLPNQTNIFCSCYHITYHVMKSVTIYMTKPTYLFYTVF